MTQAPVQPPRPRREPVMTVTQYDKSSAVMLCAVAGLIGVTILLIAVWLTNRLPPEPEPVPIEIVEMEGGFEDGEPDEQMDLESPDEEIPDPSIAETQDDQSQIEEMLEQIVELSDNASQQVEVVINADAAHSTGKKGSSKGSGKRPLGIGGGRGGVPSEQRWFVKFDDGALDVYAKQLDYFKIELGAFFPPPAKKIVYLSNLTNDKPTVREVKTGADNRLHMTHQGGGRQKADKALFAKAGVNVDGAAMLLHFYPKDSEQKLIGSELAYRNKKASEIRRSYFKVTPAAGGYKFTVTSQSYIR